MSDMDIDCVTVSEYARQTGGADYVTQIRLMQTGVGVGHISP